MTSRELPIGQARQVLEDAVAEAEQRAGWKGSGHAPIAALNREILRKHRPAEYFEAATSSECGKAWPCPTVANLLVED